MPRCMLIESIVGQQISPGSRYALNSGKIYLIIHVCSIIATSLVEVFILGENKFTLYIFFTLHLYQFSNNWPPYTCV